MPRVALLVTENLIVIIEITILKQIVIVAKVSKSFRVAVLMSIIVHYSYLLKGQCMRIIIVESN